MNQIFKHPIVSNEGLDAEDLLAIQQDREADLRAASRGAINPFTLYCDDCGLGPFGVNRCPSCCFGED